MSVNGLHRSVGVAVALVVSAAVAAVSMPAHQKKPVKLTSTVTTEYRIIQNKKKMGSEKIEKKTFDNNTILFTVDAVMTYAPGVSMTQHCELTVEEESYFPRTLHIKKTIAQPNAESFTHSIDVEMFSNVAEVNSVLHGQPGAKRLVVPTGVAIQDVGVLAYLYQTLFWYDKESGGEQRFQWMDPVAVEVHSGDIRMDPETTISVLSKKTKVSVYQVDREKFGPATLWVDSKGIIVRGDMNMFVFELVSKKTS